MTLNKKEWYDKAACAGHGPSLFYPPEDEQYSDEARAVCANCPVRIKCLNHALDHNESHGLWGGLTPAERQAYGNQPT